MTDRLQELKSRSANFLLNRSLCDEEKEENMNSCRVHEETQSISNRTTFFNDIEIVKRTIHEVQQATMAIHELLRVTTDTNISPNTSRKLSSADSKSSKSSKIVEVNNSDLIVDNDSPSAMPLSLNDIVQDINRKATVAKQLLQHLQSQLSATTSNTADTNSAEHRVHSNVLNTFSRKLVQVIRDYQAAQQVYKNTIRQRITRQLQHIQPRITVQDADAIMKTGGSTGSQFVEIAILQGEEGIHKELRNVFLQASEKHHDVVLLEASIRELQQVFVELSHTVAQQSEFLDVIESRVNESNEYIEQANKDLQQSIQLQQSTRMRQCILLLLVLIVVIVIIVVVTATTSTVGQGH